MDFPVFIKIVPHVFPFWNDLIEGDLPAKLYGCFVTEENDGLLKLDDFIQGLNLVYKGNVGDRWDLCCKMYGVNKSSTTTRRQLTAVLTIFTRMFQPKPNAFGVAFVADSDSISKFIDEKSALSPVPEGSDLVSNETVGTPEQILEHFHLKEDDIHQTFQFLLAGKIGALQEKDGNQN